jgi:hypothetical protein
VNPGQAPNEPYKDSFPMDCVKHIARRSCQCQSCGPDVVENKHYKSCMVGKAQAYLGEKVTIKPVYGG